MADFEQIEQSESGSNSFLVCENIPLLKVDFVKECLGSTKLYVKILQLLCTSQILFLPSKDIVT